MPMTWSGPAPRRARPIAAQPEPRVGDHDHRAGAPAGIDRSGQVGAGRHEQRDPVSRAHPRGGQPGGQVAHPLVQLGERTRCAGPVPARRRRASGRRRGRSRPDHSGAPGAASGWSRAAGRAVEVAYPAPHVGRGPGRVLGDQVRRALVAVHLRVRQPREQVAQVEVGEHRVPGPPQHQHRHVRQGAEPGGDPVQRRRQLGCAGSSGMSATKSPTARRRAAERVRRRERVAHRRAAARAATAPRWRGRTPGWPRRWPAAGRGPGQPDQRRRRRACRLVHRRVGRGRRPQLLAVARAAQPSDTGPPQSWRDGHDRPGDAEGRGAATPRSSTRCGQGAGRPVRSEKPMPSWSTATTRQPAGACGQEPPPQVGPRRVAVDAQHRAVHRLRTVVEDVPGAAYVVRVVRVTRRDQPRPGRASRPARGGGRCAARARVTRRFRRRRC